jgi:ubiquinone/menaquinone biosynthesis C-methylase UbiE
MSESPTAVPVATSRIGSGSELAATPDRHRSSWRPGSNGGRTISEVRYHDDAVARQYETARYWVPGVVDVWVEQIAPWFEVGPVQHRILDVGSGTGIWSEAIAERFALDVVGVEPAEGMRALATTVRRHELVTYVAGTVDALPLTRDSATGAWLSTVIHQFPDMAAAAAELRRVLVDSAPVWIRNTFVGRHDEIELFHHFPGAERWAAAWPRVDDVVGVFESVGFRMASLQRVQEPWVGSYDEFLDVLPMMRHTDSALAGLSDAEWEEGVASIRRRRDRGGRPIPVGLDLLVLS